MFGFFKKNSDDDAEQEFVYDQALLIRIPLASELGDENLRNKVISFEDQIKKHLPPLAGVDGHEFGDYEAIIYIYGPKADAMFKMCEPIIRDAFSGDGASVTLQFGLPQDKDTKEKKIFI